MADKKKVLIVEDEQALRKALVTSFKNADFEVVEASDGEAGLNKALEERPDLIMLDLIMPKMEGKTVVAELHKNSWGKTVPIIFLTNISDPIKVAEINEISSSNATLFDYLVKSDWRLEEIVGRVKDKLGMKQEV
jgi:DNA-binding response OmpR family regulator